MTVIEARGDKRRDTVSTNYLPHPSVSDGNFFWKDNENHDILH